MRENVNSGMSTFGEDMRELASELTEEFSEEIGESTLLHLISNTYNAELGENVRETSPETAYITFTGIKESEVSDISFRKEHEKAIVAGDSLLVAPAIDDYVVKPEGTEHRVVAVKKDQYKAAYIMYIEKNAT